MGFGFSPEEEDDLESDRGARSSAPYRKASPLTVVSDTAPITSLSLIVGPEGRTYR